MSRIYNKKKHWIKYGNRAVSDSYGKCEFSIHWMSNYHPGTTDEYRLAERGQYFYADPREHGFSRPEELALDK